jgi:amino acid transporter
MVPEPSAATPPIADPPPGPQLLRRFGLWQATALNMSNMVGVGPFITIPLFLTAMNGPQAMLGWAVALLITFSDAMVWAELGAALPGSGGSYVFLREGFGRETFGRLMAFLFVWQFIFSGPLEIATGYIGFARYLQYVCGDMSYWTLAAVAAGVGLLNVALLYRRITSIGKITVALWLGVLLTILVVIVSGAMHFDYRRAFDFPPGAFRFSLGFLLGLGTASRLAVYDYLGYYDVCYIGDEVRDPGRTVPRSILISLTVIAAAYVAVSLSVIGVVPWRELVPAQECRISDYVASVFMERIHGRGAATLFTVLVLWTTMGSVFALLLGYSRIPYAAALDGCFFKVFARVHPTQHFPHVALLVVGGLAIVCCAAPLDWVIDALLITRILVQFIGQSAALVALRRRAPELPRPYRVWLYPLPNLLALAGWIFLCATNQDQWILRLGLGVPIAGLLFFLVWTARTRQWPFAAGRSAVRSPE